jgi:GxxExxY protein
MRDEKTVLELWDRIRQIAFVLHTFRRHEHLEKMYENGLAHHLRKIGITLEQQKPMHVCVTGGEIPGDYFADLFIEDCLILELKACNTSAEECIASIRLSQGNKLV